MNLLIYSILGIFPIIIMANFTDLPQCLSPMPILPRVSLNRYKSFREEPECFKCFLNIQKCATEFNETNYNLESADYRTSFRFSSKLIQFNAFKNVFSKEMMILIVIYFPKKLNGCEIIPSHDIHMQCDELFANCKILLWNTDTELAPRNLESNFTELISKIFIANEGGKDYEEDLSAEHFQPKKFFDKKPDSKNEFIYLVPIFLVLILIVGFVVIKSYFW